METETTALTQPAVNVLEAIKPFEPDDSHKGTFLILRIAGMEQGMALRLVNRKYRSWQNWRATDADFYRLNEAIPILVQKFSGEARIVRTALLDISVIETGIHIFKRILRKETVSSDMWAYATKLAGIRMPLMGAKEESVNPWERLANSIRNTMARELTVREVDVFGAEKSVMAREVIIQSNPEQKRITNEIVERILSKARENN